MLIDTHTHLDFPDFDSDRDAVIRRAVEAGVTRMIAIGTNLDTSRAALALADRHPEVYATIGIHPNEVMDVPDDAVVQSTATNLRTQAESYQGGTAVGSGNPLQVTLANTGANTTALRVEPKNGAVTRTTGDTDTANTSKEALASSSSRRYLLIQNISDTDMYFNFGATATTDNMLITKNGGGIVFESGYVPTDAVNVICSGADKKYFILSA